jgi:hypothetical protein
MLLRDLRQSRDFGGMGLIHECGFFVLERLARQ